MRERGFIETKPSAAIDLIQGKDKKLVTADVNETIHSVVEKMTQLDISQIPVTNNNKIVGSVNEHKIFNFLFDNPNAKNEKVSVIMGEKFPVLNANSSIEEISKLITRENSAVLIEGIDDNYQIVTKQDIIKAFA